MRRTLILCLVASLPVAAQVAPVPTATELTSNPFAIKKSWPIGGAGNWDYLTMDAQARRLYIAHGRSVQVVDVDSGAVGGEIRGFREAHQIALDDTGEYGFVSDGLAASVAVFDRRTLDIEASIPIHFSPRSIAYEPQSKLVFAVCGATLVNPGGPVHVRPGTAPRTAPPQYGGLSHLVVVDAGKNSPIADITLGGDLRYAQADSDGHIYVTVGTAMEPRSYTSGSPYQEPTPPRIAKFDAAEILDAVRHLREGQSASASNEPVILDWSNSRNSASLLHFLPRHFFPLTNVCTNPQGLAVDANHQRLFLACDNQQFVVLDSNDAHVVASLTTGPGDDVLAYDPVHELIFIANGGGYGSLTIVQQDANTDSYTVVQNLPTMERARTLAVDSSSGEVYLVTDLHGVDLTKMGGIGTLRFDPVAGSFQVLVVGH